MNKEEKQILNAFNNKQLKKNKNSNNEIKKARQAAQSTLLKTKNINIRLSEKDLLIVKQKALSTGIPYQTIISALIHQYATDKIKIAV